jgi:hypothetical protein
MGIDLNMTGYLQTEIFHFQGPETQPASGLGTHPNGVDGQMVDSDGHITEW